MRLVTFPKPNGSAESAYRLRPVRESEAELLYELHRSAMRAYVEDVYGPWDDSVQRGLHQDFLTRCDVQVIEAFDAIAGMLAVEWRPAELHIGRIELDPRFHGRGLGSAVLRDLIAGAAPLPVTLEVIDVNPARRLYERLGFVETAIAGRKVHMRLTQPR